MIEANGWQVTDEGWLVKVGEFPEVTKAEVRAMLERRASMLVASMSQPVALLCSL